MNSIKSDFIRFKNIVKGKIKSKIEDFINRGERVIQKENGKFSIPYESIEIPRLLEGGQNQEGKVGEGESQGSGKKNKPGEEAGKKELETEFTSEDLVEILKDLGLKNLKERDGGKSIDKITYRYNTISTNGPNALKNMKKTFFNSIKRQISMGAYDDENPVFVPRKEDYRYRSFTEEYEYKNSATIFYIMDVSGSMTNDLKELARTMAFWQNIWLKSLYKDLTIRYIIHDATAKEVDEKDFFSTMVSGGTLISSAYKLLLKTVYEEKILDNIYVFQYSDGDNWSHSDNDVCKDKIKEIIKMSNQFCYTQLDSKYGSGDFIKVVDEIESDDLYIAEVKEKSDIVKSIKKFFG